MVHLNKLMGLLKIRVGNDGNVPNEGMGLFIEGRRGGVLGWGGDYLFGSVYAQLQLFVNLAEPFFKAM